MKKIKVLPIQVGGTITSIDSDSGCRPGRSFTEMLNLVDKNIIKKLAISNEKSPFGKYGIDSASMRIPQIQKIAETIKDNYEHYDAFIVIHGTDTLAYTASMLSFMLHATQKPIIVTGSQKTLDDPDSDVVGNLETSLVAASTSNCGVWVAFNNKIINAARATKIDVSVECLDSFVSNCKEEIPLTQFNANDYSINRGLTPKFIVNVAETVDIFCLTHTTNPMQLNHYLRNSSITGLIVLIYGMSGHREDLIKVLSRWSNDNDTIVIAKSHSPYGSTDLSKYELGVNALQSGVLSSLDMTLESAFSKTCLLLSEGVDRLKFNRHFYSSFSGEINEEEVQRYALRANRWLSS